MRYLRFFNPEEYEIFAACTMWGHRVLELNVVVMYGCEIQALIMFRHKVTYLAVLT